MLTEMEDFRVLKVVGYLDAIEDLAKIGAMLNMLQLQNLDWGKYANSEKIR
jgi:hypothetical protein